MSSLMRELRQLEAQQEQITERLETLRKSPALVSEFKFEKKLRELMEHYSIDLDGVIDILGRPQQATPKVNQKPGKKSPAATTEPPRRSRIKYRYQHPDTGETVTAAMETQKTVAAWIAEYGREQVMGWREAIQ